MNVPGPVPSEVLVVRAVVGFSVVLHQTPLSDINPPPSKVILPPDTAVVWLTDEAAVVVRVARSTGFDENVTSLP